MPKVDDDALVQLATRVPRGLHREVKLYCVSRGVSVMEFVAGALATKLRVTGIRVPVRRKRG